MPDKRKKVTFVKSEPAGPDGYRKVKKVKRMSEKRAKKKEAKGQGKMFKNYSTDVIRAAVSGSPAEMSPYKMGHSPMENQNKGYAEQERKDLMQDMPIVKDAIGGRSWMSKHSKSAMMMKGPMEMGHSPAEMGHESPAKHVGSAYGAKHKEEVGHGDTGMHSHAYGRQKKQDEGKERSEKRKKVKATIEAGKAIAKSM